MTFLTPLFLAGFALLAAPFLIHQIRRPEREPIRFSSLLFIPDAPREVIERRRVQHILLMLLRMLLLALLALAFARPYWKVMVIAEQPADGGDHLILLDTSYSMSGDGVFEDAQRKALGVISGLPLGDRVGVVVFADAATPTSSMHGDDDAETDSRSRARSAIAAAHVGYGGTGYVSALQLAESLLLAGVAMSEEGAADAGRARHIHVVSDFQRGGLADTREDWKLSPRIALHPIPVGDATAENYAITDVGIRRLPTGETRIVGKIKNWTDTDADGIRVGLMVNGREIASNTVAAKAGNATQTSFLVAADVFGTGALIEGSLQLKGDGLAADNARYFTWSAPRTVRVVIVQGDSQAASGADSSPADWPAHWFFEQALNAHEDSPWTVDTVSVDALPDTLSGTGARPDAVIVPQLSRLNADAVLNLGQYLRDGGRALLLIDGDLQSAPSAIEWLGSIGVAVDGLRYARTRDTRFDLLSWVDLDHALFAPFRGTHYNDFSVLRFFNHVVVDVDDTTPTIDILARFEDEAPGMVEVAVDDGVALIWPFALKLEWTNLPKSTRFVPLVHETLDYLCATDADRPLRFVGDSIATRLLFRDIAGTAQVQLPGAKSSIRMNESGDSTDSGLVLLEAPGYLRVRAEDGAAWVHVEAVNVDAAEADPATMAPDEFLVRMASAPMLFRDTDPQDTGMGLAAIAPVRADEYGRGFLLALLAFLLIESWYMGRVTR
ncbi:MAG: BatA and WFA domain-containing protein [Candidatus Hydrogenedentes bacterium]|nr:BatA and WFA domain-containing protein [Candidatus Hydrogenedentota bacterium]